MANVIGAGKIVELKYTMRNEFGKVLDKSDGTETYTHGAGSIVSGLELALEGHAAGERFEVSVPAEDGFGPRHSNAPPQPVPRSTFPADAELHIGMAFEAETPGGEPMKLFITRIEEEEVFVDSNHPFSGITLEYSVEIVSVTDA